MGSHAHACRSLHERCCADGLEGPLGTVLLLARAFDPLLGGMSAEMLSQSSQKSLQ